MESGRQNDGVMGEDLDRLKFLAEYHQRQHHERRAYEFRVLLQALGFYFLAAGAAITGRVNLQCRIDVLIWIVFLLVAVLTWIQLTNIHIANATDLEGANRARNGIDAWRREATDKPRKKENESETKCEEPTKPPLSWCVIRDKCKMKGKCWRDWRRDILLLPTLNANWSCQSVLLFVFAIAAAVIVTGSAGLATRCGVPPTP